MRTKRIGIGQLIVGMCLSGLLLSTAKAAEPTWFGETADGRWLVGLRTYIVQNSADDFNNAKNNGLVLGYEFSRPMGYNGSSTIEFEATTTYEDGDIGAGSVFGVPGKWDIDTFAIQFAYKTPGTVYFKGKLGAIHSDLHTTAPGINIETKEVSLAFGAGLGVNAGKNVEIEVEFNGSTGDNDFSLLSIGANLLF